MSNDDLIQVKQEPGGEDGEEIGQTKRSREEPGGSWRFKRVKEEV